MDGHLNVKFHSSIYDTWNVTTWRRKFLRSPKYGSMFSCRHCLTWKRLECSVVRHKVTPILSFNASYSCLFLARQPPVGQGLLIHEDFRAHTTTYHNRWESPGRVISSSQRPLPDNTHTTLTTDIRAPSGNRTDNISRRGAADLRLKRPIHSQLNWAILLCDVISDGKTE